MKSIGATVGPRAWAVMMRGMASTGREVKFAREYDEQRRRSAVGRVE